MFSRSTFAVIIAVVVLLLFGVSLAVTQGVDSQRPASTAAAPGTAFTYQGQLEDANGDPVNDSCDFQFDLYDAATNGALLAILLGAGVGYGRWLRFALPGCALVAVVGAIGVLLSA